MATIGISKPYFAIYKNSSGVISYENGGVLGKATEANITINVTEDNNLYADNSIAESEKAFTDGTITLSTDDLSQEVSKAILGAKEISLDSISGVTDLDVKEIIYDDDQNIPYVGIGVIIKKKVAGQYKWRGVIMTKAMFSIPADAAVTQGDSIEWQVPTLTATIMRDDSEKHCWKKEATFTSEAQAEAYIRNRLGVI